MAAKSALAQLTDESPRLKLTAKPQPRPPLWSFYRALLAAPPPDKLKPEAAALITLHAAKLQKAEVEKWETDVLNAKKPAEGEPEPVLPPQPKLPEDMSDAEAVAWWRMFLRRHPREGYAALNGNQFEFMNASGFFANPDKNDMSGNRRAAKVRAEMGAYTSYRGD